MAEKLTIQSIVTDNRITAQFTDKALPRYARHGELYVVAGILYIYADLDDSNKGKWFPLTYEKEIFTYETNIASNQWTIPIDFQTDNIIVIVYDQEGKVYPKDFDTNIENQIITISFSEEVYGQAYIIINKAFDWVDRRLVVADRRFAVTENPNDVNQYFIELDTEYLEILKNGNTTFRSDVTISGTLNVVGDTTYSGNQSLDGDVNIGGNLSTNGTITSINNFFAKMNATIEGDLEVKGDTIIDGTLQVGGDTNIDGNLTISGQSGSNVEINTTSLTVEDNVVTLNKGMVGTPTKNVGIEADRGDEGILPIVTFDETNDAITIPVLQENGSFLQDEVANKTFTFDEISKENTRAINVETTLQSNIDVEKGRITQEITDRSNALTNIQTELDVTQSNIGLEADGSYTADDTTNYITTASNIMNADKLLDTQIKSNADNLTQEITDRSDSDDVLQSNIDTEKGRIDSILNASEADKDSFKEIVDLINSVDTENDKAFAGYVTSNDSRSDSIESNLSQEITDRTDADSTLQSNIDTVNTNLSTHSNKTDNPHGVTKAQVGLGDVDNIKDIDKEVLSSTKLTTARTINVNGDQTGSVSFDGSKDVTLTLSNVAANLLSDLKTVDGSGSGLDADLLDGFDSLQSLMYKGNIPDSIDLNTYNTAGLYHQRSNTFASNGTNYPIADAGMLTVKEDGKMVYQTYEVYGNYNRTFTRTYYDNIWYPWKEIFHFGDKATDADKLDGHDSSYFATADINSNGSITTLNDQWHNASNTLSGYVNDGGGNSGFRFNATPGASNKLVEDGEAFKMDFENDSDAGLTGRFSFNRGTSANSTAGDDITWDEVFAVEQGTGRVLLNTQTILQAGSWADNKGTDTQGVIIQGTAPALYFDQTDATDANAYVGINAGSFYILPDADSNGSYTGEGPYGFNLDVSTGNTTIGGFVNATELIARENVLKVQRAGSTNQYIQIDQDKSLVTAPTVTSFTAVNNAKTLRIGSTTNATNDAPTSGTVGVNLNVLGNDIVEVKSDEVKLHKDLNFNNLALISNTDGTGSNIDHIWHNDTENAWNFVTDGTYKQSGNSRINAGSITLDHGNTNGDGDGFVIHTVNTKSVADKHQAAARIAQTYQGDNTPSADRVLRGLYTSISDNSTGNNTTDKERFVRGLETFTVINGDSTRNYASQNFADSRKSSGTMIELKGSYNVARDYSKDGVTAQNVYGSMSFGIKGKYGAETDSNLSSLFGAYNKVYTESDYTKTVSYARGTYSEVEINGTDDVHISTVEAYKAVIDNNKSATNVDNTYLFRGVYEGPAPTNGHAWGIYIDTNVGNYFKGYIKTDRGLVSSSLTTANGTEVVINVGESTNKVSDETGELLYVNAEAGLSINTPDRAHSNWDAGYTVETTLIRGDIVSLGNTQVYAHGDDRIKLKPDTAGGNVAIRFDSNQNYNSDYGWIKYFDDNNNYNKWGDDAENSALVMGVANDGQVESSDVVALESPAGIFLNAPDVYVGDKTTLKNFSAYDVYVGGTLTEASDKRLKENVETINNALDKVKKLRGVEYNKIKTPDIKEIGFIAQEVEEIVPEIVKTDAEGMKSVSYQRTVALLTEAMKEQQKEIDELKTLINSLIKD